MALKKRFSKSELARALRGGETLTVKELERANQLLETMWPYAQEELKQLLNGQPELFHD